MSNHLVPASSDAPAPVDLDAVNDPATRMWIVDPDELMAELGRRVQHEYRGAATTAAGVRAIRESWEQPRPARRPLRELTRGAGTVLFASCMTIAWGLVALGLYVWIAR